MRGKTILASFVTLVFMGGFVFTTIVATVIATRSQTAGGALVLALAFTCGWAFLSWLFSPLIMDLVQRFLYGAREFPLEELRAQHPSVADFVEQVSARHKIKTPRLKIIDDNTPQAYCYGSHGDNARLVITRGLMKYLNDEELEAVYGHELGHIVHRDFIVMTVAATLLNVLWTIYVVARNIRGKNNSRPGMPIALVAFVFWWISQYLLMYLSRTREYYADEFSGAETGNPNALSSALVKIAYGLSRLVPTERSTRLLGGTRALGIADYKSAKGAGFAYQSVGGAEPRSAKPAFAGAAAVAEPAFDDARAPAAPFRLSLEGVRRVEKVMLYDQHNPWATVSELSATHPLTGKRILALSEQAQALGQRPFISMEAVDAFGQAIDKGRLYSTFFFEVLIYFAPQMLGVLGALVALGGAVTGRPGLAPAVLLGSIGLGLTVKGFYRFGPLGDAPLSSVFELMGDPYASPLKGRPVRLSGTVIGRVDAGGKLSEDVMIEDAEGGLMALNYESPFGALGNWWFARRTVGKLIDTRVEALGWFRRGVSQQVDLRELRTTDGESLSSWTGFWGRAGGVLLLALGVIVGVLTGLA